MGQGHQGRPGARAGQGGGRPAQTDGSAVPGGMDENTRPSRPSRIPYAVAAAVLFALVTFAWFARGWYQPVTAGAEAPPFSAFTLEGDEVGLEAYRGKVILLNIWATWCAPCRDEMPSMERLHHVVDDPDFEIVAVSVDARLGERDAAGNAGGDLQAFIEEYGLTFTVLHDPSGGIQRTYQTTGVPESFLIGRDGVIYRRLAGPTEWDAPQYAEAIGRLLQED